MAFYTAKTDAESIAEETGGGKYINQSGIYDVTIIVPFVDVNDKDARTVNFFIEKDGQQQPLYGNLKLDNNDGSENFAAKIFNKFLIIADCESVDDPIEADLPIGKKGADKTCSVLESLENIECKVRVQMEYGVYNGNITEKKVIKGFYTVDGASAEELINSSEAGLQLEKDLPYASNVTYKDGTTEESIKTWIAAKRPKGTGSACATSGGGAAAGGGTAKKKPSFGKK